MAELKGRSSQLVYANASLGLIVNLKGNEANVLLRGEKGKSMLNPAFFASNAVKLASNHVLRASSDGDFLFYPKQRGLSFNGSSNYVVLPAAAASAIHGTTEATIEFWVKKNAIQYGFIQLSGFPSFNGNLYPYLEATKVYLDVFRSNRLGPIYMLSTTLEWHHFAVTSMPGTNGWKLYQNGQLVYQYTGESTIKTNYLAFEIGRNSSSRYADAKFDDVRLWNYARSQAEIQEHMNHELKGDEPGLVGYWKFNEGSGTTAYDSSPNGYHGTIYGATYFTEL